MYVDVHTHLTHEKFLNDIPEVVSRAREAGVAAMVVNGLEPQSNREIIRLQDEYPEIMAALGIYPIEAVNGMVGEEFPIEVKRFPVDEELDFIEQQALAGHCAAIGECGLDGYWVGEETFAEQERVFERLIEIAGKANLPLIIHTRKREQRAMEILAHHGVQRVNFHCYGGKVKRALRAATEHGWFFSIPANARNDQAFTKMLKEMPREQLLTETDAPYLAPVRGERNEPANVVGTVAYLAELRGWSLEEARDQIRQNFQRLFRRDA
jgi:TatD DNase family protein